MAGLAGLVGLVLAPMLVAEIVFTMWDFVIEIAVRKPLGDVYGGERITHAIMGIVYGGMLAFLIPILWSWWLLPTALVARPLAELTAAGLGAAGDGARRLPFRRPRPVRRAGAAGRLLAVAAC